MPRLLDGTLKESLGPKAICLSVDRSIDSRYCANNRISRMNDSLSDADFDRESGPIGGRVKKCGWKAPVWLTS